MIIPEEARATMAAYREGLTLAAYLDFMWLRRAAENPPAPRLRRHKWNWPVGKRKSATVTNIKSKRGAGNG